MNSCCMQHAANIAGYIAILLINKYQVSYFLDFYLIGLQRLLVHYFIFQICMIKAWAKLNDKILPQAETDALWV